MALQITQKKGTFYLKGKLNTSTSEFFIVYFEYNIEKSKKVTINIGNLVEISEDGLDAINTLRLIALRQGKMFSIIGYGCKEIYDHFNEMHVA